MKALALAGLVLLLVASASAQDLLSPAEPGKDARDAKPRLSLDMDDPAIRKAVHDTLAEDKSEPLKADGRVLRGDASYKAFSRQMDEATVPDCLHSDALKHQPPMIGPIPVVGIFILPFWAAAALRGKCH
ncbi:MAG TPA: hypothetical protein VF793_18365 [Telluria sp.]|jgi:hypothetical protein